MLLSFALTALLVRQTVAQECYFPSGKLHEKAIPCGSGGVSACCEPSQTCLSNGLCYDITSNRPIRASCTDKNWASDLCPRYCTSEQRESATEIRLCSGSSDRWTCGARSDDCSPNFTVPMGQVADSRPFSQNGILQAATCATDSSSNTGGRPVGRPPWATACAAPTATVTANSDASIAAAVAAAQGTGDRSQEKIVVVGVGVGLGIGLPLICALVAILFLWRRAERDTKAARDELDAYREGRSQSSPLQHQCDCSTLSSAPILSSMPLHGAAGREKPLRTVHEADVGYGMVYQMPNESTHVIHEAPSDVQSQHASVLLDYHISPSSARSLNSQPPTARPGKS